MSSVSIVLDCFYLLIFYSEKFSTDVCCLPFAVNVNLNLSNVCLHLRSFPLRADWRKSNSSVDGEPQGNWRWNSNSRARGGYSLYISFIGMCRPIGQGFEPFWSENGYILCPFWSEVGYGF